jgi:acid phosphatase family membrane protein YuiD
LVVLALASALGVFFSIGINEGWDSYVFVIMVMVLQAAIVLGSLLVVRSCGYRLVRQTKSRLDRSEQAAPADASRSG